MLQQISHVNGVGNSFDGTYFAVVVPLLGLSQTDTHDKHTSCLSQQLLHIRDHKHTANQSRNAICTRLGGFSSSRFFSRVFLRANRLNYKKAFIYIR
jgi:hypothetical protein